tara:strand:+ start:267 stop:497 length:231 start_codon:yes stop_codon:yes gene_type:complete
MKLESLGANKTLLSLPNGSQVFISYKTPVAAKLESGFYVRTSYNHSRTTQRHITQWLGKNDCQLVNQSFLDNLMGA